MAVRDEVRKRTIIVRKGKYRTRARRRPAVTGPRPRAGGARASSCWRARTPARGHVLRDRLRRRRRDVHPARALTLRQAITTAEQSAGAHTIVLPAGTIRLELGPLAIAHSAVTVRGASARTTSVIATPGGARVRDRRDHGDDRAADDVRRRRARANAGFHGGNLRNQSGTVTLDHVRVTDGRAFSGGGVANRNGTMLIQNSLIDHNFAIDGGGDGGGVINFGGDGGAPATLVVARLDDRLQHRSARRRADRLRQPRRLGHARGRHARPQPRDRPRDRRRQRGSGQLPGPRVDLLRQRVRRGPVELRDACR